MHRRHSGGRMILMGPVAIVLWVVAAPAPAGVCGPGNGDCCARGGNGTPGCEDEACCEAICADDPFCCDTSWDGICADAAQKSCDVCTGGGEGCCIDKWCDANDQCEDAFPISNGDVVEGGTCAAAGCDSDGSASCGASEDSPDVWYEFTASCDAVAHAETCGSLYDTVLSVHSDCPGDTGNQIACNDDFCDLQSGVDWNTTAGTTYWIRVSGWNGECGDFTLFVDSEICCNPPCDQCSDCVGGECQDNGECCEGCGMCDGDVNCDWAVDPLDSGAVLARFGLDPCNEENCKYDVNCDGAIDPLDSGYVLARFGQCNQPEVCKICSDNVFNDTCEEAPVDTLNVGETLSYDGDNTDATMTCAAGGFPEVWHAFDLTATADVTCSYCGTDPPFGNAYIVIDPECPCSGNFVFASNFDQFTCDDGNWAMHYDGLPAGDYWTPILQDGSSMGKYTWNISAAGPPPPPENDDCADAADLFDGVTAFDTNTATTDGVNPLPPECEEGFGLDIVNDIWYHYTATCTGTATMSTCDDADYDTRMAAYLGTDCPTDNGALAGCNDDGPGCSGFTTIMEVSVVAGETYKIRLGGFGGSGTGNLTVSCP